MQLAPESPMLLNFVATWHKLVKDKRQIGNVQKEPDLEGIHYVITYVRIQLLHRPRCHYPG